MSTTALARERRARFREHYHKSPSFLLVNQISIPANIETREESAPCFKCGVRATVPCKHRPWVHG